MSTRFISDPHPPTYPVFVMKDYLSVVYRSPTTTFSKISSNDFAKKNNEKMILYENPN